MIDVASDELEQRTWHESVQLAAEGTFFDGLSMVELYPECVTDMKKASQIDDSSEFVETIDVCFLNANLDADIA